ncbi:MAG: glycoside hydrolase family protein [Bacteroidetes bacterium]|jgi:hypothetical protein|nr:glycoside hydrolase family protein [Bacteroidota bacterium]MDF2451843.1 glycoside hydrolase family protein [Bacteroidota bacterium]
MKSAIYHSDNTSGIKFRLSSGKTIGLIVIFFMIQMGVIYGQKVTYDNFEGRKFIHYGERTGVLDSLARNPVMDSVNKSQKCAFYTRNGAKKFDNIKMYVHGRLTGVNEYATYLGIPPRFKIKVYTSAPAGTLVEILIGSKNGNNDYPAGTNSQYQTYTTKTNAWEELEFKFSQVPQGSETAFDQIDQVTLLFNPNSSTSDTYYFDDITGPGIVEKQEPIAAPVTPEINNDSSKKTESPKKNTPVKKENPNKKLSKN